ncbi:MAG: hypothetical protein Ct9H90mP23_2690 [Methanobacteriota archaeon]|nr:MAG: hypothetical protein Ct9H90mP23_2690 [Euryarchaeota archaeon]
MPTLTVLPKKKSIFPKSTTFPGMTGEQQVNFAGIDVSGKSFNSPVQFILKERFGAA